MQLLPQHIKKQLPPLYAGEEKGMEALALVKFFTPDSGWSWFATEFDGEDIFFGLAVGHEAECGYFSLSELRSVRGGLGLPVERDLYFKPTSLKVLKETYQRY